MGRKSILATCALALIAVGAFAGVSLAGSEGANTTNRGPQVLKTVTATLAGPNGQASKAASKPKGKTKKPTIQFGYLGRVTVPAEGAVVGIRCPKSAGEPISGGAGTDAGITLSYLSRVKPGTNKTPARTYYVGADDVSTTNSAQAGYFPQVQCAKGITVKR